MLEPYPLPPTSHTVVNDDTPCLFVAGKFEGKKQLLSRTGKVLFHFVFLKCHNVKIAQITKK